MGKHRFRLNRRLFNQSLRRKLILPVMVTMAILLGVNLLMFGRINNTVDHMDQVYATNIHLGELEEILTEMESSVYQYLNVQSQEALTTFLHNREQFEAAISEIDDRVTGHPARRMERNIRNLGLSYLEMADAAVQAKQTHHVAAYKENFEETKKIYTYLLACIQGLDSMRFEANSENYGALYRYLRYLEVFMTAALVIVTCCLTVLLYVIIGTFIRPLEKLAGKAKEVEKGNLGIATEEPESEDEVGTVTAAFNQMIISINAYIQRISESMELEIRMKEREMAMESLLKDAQLKYYQAQINPHFLFNTLNAGQQLAMMEDAERTYTFMEHMASFFRYRLKKNGEKSTLREELGLIDSYMYIMNVRYSNEIHLENEIDPRLLDIRFPGMVLQPLIENALRHGLASVEWEKRLWLSARQENGEAVICVRDNGVGIPEEILKELKADSPHLSTEQNDSGNGVGLVNVRERLRLFYDRTDVMTVENAGEQAEYGTGALITIRIPVQSGGPAG